MRRLDWILAIAGAAGALVFAAAVRESAGHHQEPLAAPLPGEGFTVRTWLSVTRGGALEARIETPARKVELEPSHPSPRTVVEVSLAKERGTFRKTWRLDSWTAGCEGRAQISVSCAATDV